ncbi:S-ribosylhomocysteine lyase [Mycobacterium simulans]|uniref:S-ribosylhomocysteine lyase n=1 Tax=Mycobacterium simulans TaxID=627089 RepID=A0A7Z7NCA0_9MYCO|nr:S-ribosylhomocysteine lyase [Mycobacterium simulans]SOJ56827.1 S-ribosylhomocysteine lyase [Mycobacterium simulans]SON60995.1 S-ribosylhomocysteine lyase [Mycobacterium simulans]
MVDLKQLGWDAETVGELDHRLLRAPHVKLRSANEGSKGDVVYCVDLRISQPNVEFLSSTEMHSLEHFLLYGFLKYMTPNFLSVGLMGCQTGFYLVLYNEGHAETICNAYEAILNDVLVASEVPYANVQQCGNAENHSVQLAQAVAKKVLDARANWRRVV